MQAASVCASEAVLPLGAGTDTLLLLPSDDQCLGGNDLQTLQLQLWCW